MPLGEVSPDPVAEVSEGSTAQFSQHRDFTGFEGIVWLTTALRPTDSTTRQLKSELFENPSTFFQLEVLIYILPLSALRATHVCVRHAGWSCTEAGRAAAVATVSLLRRSSSNSLSAAAAERQLCCELARPRLSNSSCAGPEQVPTELQPLNCRAAAACRRA